MAGSLNKVQLIGNLGADPEIRATPSGAQVANFRVAEPIEQPRPSALSRIWAILRGRG